MKISSTDEEKEVTNLAEMEIENQNQREHKKDYL